LQLLGYEKRFHTAWVKSVALCNGRPRLDFRYTPLATKLARHCNMSRRATSSHSIISSAQQVQASCDCRHARAL
jgi:hypothetical protein